MKATLLMGSASRKAGGLLDAVRRLAQELCGAWGVDVSILTLADEYTADDLHLWDPLNPRAFTVRGPESFGYAPQLADALAQTEADLVHAHGLWMYASVASLRWSQRMRRPYLITPHGMLDSWALNHSRWKKRLAARLFEGAHLRNAACIHALCPSEARAIRNFGLANPICVIPNGIDLPPAEQSVRLPSWHNRAEPGRRTLLYLGRIHPKKGLETLVRAWAVLRLRGSPEAKLWDLVIAGWDQNGHAGQLRNLARQLRIEERVHFPGPQFGQDKAAAYAHADAFVLPSLSEGLPMVVLEAWAYGLPVLKTAACNLPEGFRAQAAFKIEPAVEALADGLEHFFSLPRPRQEAMGKNGRVLVEAQFSWPHVASQMNDVYTWVAHGGPAPATVQFS